MHLYEQFPPNDSTITMLRRLRHGGQVPWRGSIAAYWPVSYLTAPCYCSRQGGRPQQQRVQAQQLRRWWGAADTGAPPRTYAPRAEGTTAACLGSSSPPPPWIREIRGSAPFDAAPGSAPRRSVSRRCGRRGIPVICAASSVGADLGALFQGRGKPIRVDWTLQRKPSSRWGKRERVGGRREQKLEGGRREREREKAVAFAWGSHCGCRGGGKVGE
jgi:hypothetical protein